MFAYFSILVVSYGDFSRYAKNHKEMQFGNFSLIFNLIIFSFFALLLTIGSDIILTKNLISAEKLLTNPNDIIAKFNNSVLTVFSLIFILVSMLSTNLIANFVPSQNALINFLPNSLTLNKASYVIIFFGLLVGGFWLSIFSQSNTIFIIDNITGFFGPIFGIVVADFYYIKKQKINHKELFYPKENTEYIYSSGWNYKAIYSLIIGFIFSASTIWNVSLNSLQSFGWIIGAFISFILYFLLNNDQ
jgi:NCS1 family nucleobase:cation symporter-1